MTSNDTRLQNLLFLFSAMPMATGCIIVSDDEDDSETAGATSGATDPTTAGESSGGADTSGSAGDTTNGTTAGGETAGDETAGGETAGDETAGGETGEEIPAVCSEYGDLVQECAMSEELALEARELCTYLTDEYFDLGGEACQAAYEDFVACLNALSCEEFLSEDPVCEKASAGIDAACPVKARPDRSRLNH